MPKFDAGSVVERLEFTFEPFHDARGIVPEPNDRQIADFLSGMKDVIKSAEGLAKLGDVDPNDPQAMLDAMNSLDGDDYVTVMQQMCALFSKLCSGMPSAETLIQVPLRPRRLFFEWIQQEVLTPEAGPAAGTQPVPIRPQAVGG